MFQRVFGHGVLHFKNITEYIQLVNRHKLYEFFFTSLKIVPVMKQNEALQNL